MRRRERDSEAGRRGFTLLELVVTVLIIGILAAFAVPQYLKSVESSKADEAVALVNMVGTTNRMYALDHGGVWAEGLLTNACNAACCAGSPGCGASVRSACNLVACKYMAAADFNGKPYVAWATDPGGSYCNWIGVGVACVRRRLVSDSPNNGYASQTPYTGWGYLFDRNGVITAAGGAPPPAP